jgi:hypothetical protein
MDTDYGVDLGSILEAIDTAEVITLRFVTISHRVLFDTRHSEAEGLLIKVVPSAASLDERFKSIKQLRPRFKLREKVIAIWWPRDISSLEGCGVWGRLLKRVRKSRFPRMADGGQVMLRELIQRERAEIFNGISGAGYRTLWERRG